jgi:hypothetical protein
MEKLSWRTNNPMNASTMKNPESMNHHRRRPTMFRFGDSCPRKVSMK